MIYVVFGPTASGKSTLAHKLSDKFNAPIINIDAFQIYKDMDIGTNKVKKDDPYFYKYHLLDVVEPSSSYSVAQYQKIFRKTLDDILKQNSDVVVVGGTGLYIKASFFDYDFKEEEWSSKDYSSYSNEELYEMLKSVDEKACNTIHINNRKRVIRALQIYETHKESKSDLISKQEHKLIYDENKVMFIFLNPDREKLYEKINKRVEEMFMLGLVEEVEFLCEKYRLSTTAKQAIGYKEIIEYLNGNLDKDEAKELIKKRTRNYAKRQVTFFKNQFKSKVFSSIDEAFEGICNE